MPWNDLASNQTISFNNLQNAVDTGLFAQKSTIPVSNEQITKADADACVYINTLFGPFASKTSNQLVVKSNLECISPVFNTQDYLWEGIANNETTSSPIQLLAGQFLNSGEGKIFISNDFGINYSNSGFLVSDALLDVKFMPGFTLNTTTSYPRFLAVGINGEMIVNAAENCTAWASASSPTVRDLYAIDFNDAGVAIVVGDNRIIKTNTNYRLQNWSIVNSGTQLWRAVASDGSGFVAVGNDRSILVGTSSGTIWSAGNMPPLTAPTITLTGVTHHNDSYWYAVGITSLGAPFIMKSTDSFGYNWEIYSTTGDSFIGPLWSISSINGRLIVGGVNYQYQITGGSVRRCGANTGGVSIRWNSIVKDASTSSGFDMAGTNGATIGAYSVF